MKKQNEDGAELTEEAGPSLATVLAALVELQRQQGETAKTHLKRSAPKSNTAAPLISAFNPRGEKDFPMEELKCEVNMPFPQKPGMHGMDREEVALMNLVVPGDYVIMLNDDAPQQVSIIGKKNHATGKIEQMNFSGPIDPDTGHPTPLYTASNRQQFPSLRSMLRQIVGDAADSVMPIIAERKLVAKGELSVSVGE